VATTARLRLPLRQGLRLALAPAGGLRLRLPAEGLRLLQPEGVRLAGIPWLRLVITAKRASSQKGVLEMGDVVAGGRAGAATHLQYAQCGALITAAVASPRG
jgi:hypothetical protein